MGALMGVRLIFNLNPSNFILDPIPHHIIRKMTMLKSSLGISYFIHEYLQRNIQQRLKSPTRHKKRDEIENKWINRVLIIPGGATIALLHKDTSWEGQFKLLRYEPMI